MICKRCEDEENRIDGYCSIYCRDMDDEEGEVIALKEQIKELKAENEKLREAYK